MAVCSLHPVHPGERRVPRSRGYWHDSFMLKNVLRSVVRRLRTTDCGKFESVGKYVFEHGEQDATSAEFSAGPLHYEKMDKLRSSSLRKPQTNL